MKAITFDGRLELTDRPYPQAAHGEAIIRVHKAGICNTDLEIMQGYLGFMGILGHEFVGTVEEAPVDEAYLIGKRVVGEINCGCRRCSYCAANLAKHCSDRTTLGISGKEGAFAEYCTLPVDNLHLVPQNVSDDEAVFVEPLAAAFEITEQVQAKPTNRILVLGDGKLGLLCALVLSLTGADVALAGRHRNKLAIAENQGIRTIDVSDNRGLPARTYDLVVEATGSPEGFEQALGVVKPRGTVVLKSTTADRMTINMALPVRNEITLVGSRCGPFEPAIAALAKGRINVRPLITGVYPFTEAQEAFARARNRESLKIIIDFLSTAS